MKINDFIATLQNIQKNLGDVDVQIQDDGKTAETIRAFESFFVIPEEYDDGWRVNLRWWPY